MSTPVNTYQIPVVNVPQSFNISLAGKAYTMTCKWNDAQDAGWLIGFIDAVTGTVIVDNIPLISGANILDGLDYLGFQGTMTVFNTGSDTLAVPTLDNLGIECLLLFSTSVPNG